MKLAIISDLHLGKRMYRTDENGINKYENIGYRVFDEYIDNIISENPDLIINAGDIFETANPSILAMNKYVLGQKRLKNIPTMTILGNHDFAFNNKNNNCSAAAMASHTYFADYDIKTVELEGILFVMMPYLYAKKEAIAEYFEKCKILTESSSCEKKILVTHGVTDKYAKDSLISDPYMQFSDEFINMFDLVIIGHIHTPYDYVQNGTLVISPGAMIDYQAYVDRTGPIYLDTDTMEFTKKKIRTPHIIKKKCTEDDINDILSNVDENIYHITYRGDTNKIDNDLFIQAKNICVNLVIDVDNIDENEAEDSSIDTSLNFLDWVNKNYSDYVEIFKNAMSEGGKLN